MTSTGGALPFSVTAQTDSAWLTVTPTTGTTTGALTITADGRNLLPGIYNGTITIQASGRIEQPATGACHANGAAAASRLRSAPARLVFNAASPSTPPASQSVNVQGSGNGMTLKTTVTTGTGGNWLTVVPTEANLPATLTISIIPQTLATLTPGTYTGAVRIESPTSTNSPQTVTVTLNVAAALPGVLGVVNAASYLAGAVAPGELLYITGTNMGPAALSVAKANPAFPTVSMRSVCCSTTYRLRWSM